MDETPQLQALVLSQQRVLLDADARYEHLRTKYDSLRTCVDPQAADCVRCGLWYHLDHLDVCATNNCGYWGDYQCENCRITCSGCSFAFCAACQSMGAHCHGCNDFYCFDCEEKLVLCTCPNCDD